MRSCQSAAGPSALGRILGLDAACVNSLCMHTTPGLAGLADIEPPSDKAPGGGFPVSSRHPTGLVGQPWLSNEVRRPRDDCGTVWRSGITWLLDRPYSMLQVAQCLVVCRSLKRMDTSTRRPRQGAPLCTRCMRRRCGDTPMLSQVLCATPCDTWRETRHAVSGGSDRPPASLLPRRPR